MLLLSLSLVTIELPRNSGSKQKVLPHSRWRSLQLVYGLQTLYNLINIGVWISSCVWLITLLKLLGAADCIIKTKFRLVVNIDRSFFVGGKPTLQLGEDIIAVAKGPHILKVDQQP